MSTNFTEKQREVVARKMGYDGPMQMFDEYLASSPSDATRFAGITSKVATKMASGGFVRGYAVGGVVTKISDDEIKAFYEQNKGNVAALKQAAQQYGVTPADVARATGTDANQITSFLNAS